MNHSHARRLILLSLATIGIRVSAKDFPGSPIKMVVPYTPGGVADVFARMLGDIMAKDLGQPVVIENRPGANTMVGAGIVAQAPPDGYTVFQTTSVLLLNPLLYKKLSYDPKALKPVAIGFEAPLVVLVNNDVPARNMKEFVTYARANRGKVNYSTIGPGNALHFVAELFKQAGDFDMTHISYAGKSGEAFSAILSGTVQFMATIVAQAMTSIQAGKVRALAVTSDERLPALPDVPTVAEEGFPGLKAATWYGLALNPAVPASVVARLVKAFDVALVNPAFRKHFTDQGMVMQQPRTQAEVDAYAAAELKRWSGLIREQKIALD